jgi:hypothetical protein
MPHELCQIGVTGSVSSAALEITERKGQEHVNVTTRRLN